MRHILHSNNACGMHFTSRGTLSWACPALLIYGLFLPLRTILAFQDGKKYSQGRQGLERGFFSMLYHSQAMAVPCSRTQHRKRREAQAGLNHCVTLSRSPPTTDISSSLDEGSRPPCPDFSHSVSLQTTIMAVEFDGGVVVGSDSRVSAG